MGIFDEVRFPCDRIPEDVRKVRLLGIYSQRQEGLVLQRIKIPGGKIRLDQWRCLAMLARQYTREYPLHITTRQDVELHGIRPEDLPAIQAEIAERGMTCVGAAGDSVRNLVVCPEDGLRQGTWEVDGLAKAIQTHVESLGWGADLPRKFKISLSGCPWACTRPWIQDLGLVANPDGTFRAMVAGSLGANPGTGLLLFESLKLEEVLPLVHALLKLFHEEGDRAHRYRARLRHVRERLGDTAFIQRIHVILQAELEAWHDPVPPMYQVENDTPLQCRLSLPLGDITAENALRLADSLEKAETELRIGLEHDLLLFGDVLPELNAELADFQEGVSVLACPGSTWCTRGIVDSRDAARRIRRRLPDNDSVAVAIGGCLNNCSQAAVAPIGLLGCVKKVGGKRVEGFRVLVGGGGGYTPALGRQLHPFVASEEIDEAVAFLVQTYHRLDGDSDTTFEDFVEREFSYLQEIFHRRFNHPGKQDDEKK